MYLTIFGKPRYLGLVVPEEGEPEFEKGDRLLIESPRGVEVAVVAGRIDERQEALYRAIDNRQEGQSSSDAGLQDVRLIRPVSDLDLENEDINRSDENEALVISRKILSNHPELNMKLVDVEYMNDRKKLFLYFTSEQRVDFRAYVRDLAREFHTRIELRQIGVRDEAKVVRGIGACGRVCCCSYWLQKFSPIGIRMVKEQNLALNPAKISGLCGRLMCCMSFEQETYHELWKELPNHGAKIRTEQGTWVLVGVDLAHETCTLHGPNGFVNVPVSLYYEFKETLLAGKTWNNEEHGLDEKGYFLSGKKPGCSCTGSCQGCRAGQESDSVTLCGASAQAQSAENAPETGTAAEGVVPAGENLSSSGNAQETGADRGPRRRKRSPRRNDAPASRAEHADHARKKTAPRPERQENRSEDGTPRPPRRREGNRGTPRPAPQDGEKRPDRERSARPPRHPHRAPKERPEGSRGGSPEKGSV